MFIKDKNTHAEAISIFGSVKFTFQLNCCRIVNLVNNNNGSPLDFDDL